MSEPLHIMTTTLEAFPNQLLALCIWREARNQSRMAKLGVKWIILNRVANPKGPYVHCSTVVQTILCPLQFSSFNPDDANAKLLPNPIHAEDFAAFIQCCEVVDSQDPDPTGGATHYFSTDIAPPSWADPAKQTATVGNFRFYKL